MFGYIAPNLGALTEEQRQRYREYYCGLCRTLGEISGKSGRLLLSHDMTFLAMLLNSLTEPEEERVAFRCAAHPAKKREVIQNQAIHYAAGMNLVLMDLKCADQVRDDHSAAGKAERRMLQKPVAALRAEYPSQTREITSVLEALWEEEQRPEPDPDRLANLSGQMLGAAFVPSWVDPFWREGVRGLGESLGRFVYWMDAWEDREEDRRKGHVNPLWRWEEQADLEAFVRAVLEMMMGEATTWFEALPLEKDIDLLRNVLYSGVWQRYEAMGKRGKKEREKA